MRSTGKQFPAWHPVGNAFLGIQNPPRRLQVGPRARNKTQNLAQKPQQILVFQKSPLIHQFQHCHHPQHPQFTEPRRPRTGFFPGKTQFPQDRRGKTTAEWKNKILCSKSKALSKGMEFQLFHSWVMPGVALGFPRGFLVFLFFFSFFFPQS